MKIIKIIVPAALSIIIFAVLGLFFFTIDVPYDIGGNGTGRAPAEKSVTSNILMYDEETVTADKHLENLSILFGTFERKNTNTNKITVYLNSNKVAERTFSSKNIKDNTDYKLENLNLDVKAGDKLRIEYVSSDGTKANSVVPYIITGTANGSKLYVKDLTTGKVTEREGRIAANFNKTVTVFFYAPTKYFNQSPVAGWICVAAVFLLTSAAFVLFFVPEKKEFNE